MKQMQKRTCMGIVLLILTLTMTACSTETIELSTSKFSTRSDDADTTPTEDLETSLLPNEAFENVLLNQRRFSYTDSNSNPIYQSNVYLSEIAAEDQSTMSLPKFAVVDMDGDELPEVVYQRGDYMGFISAVLGTRILQFLKRDLHDSWTADSAVLGMLLRVSRQQDPPDPRFLNRVLPIHPP